MCGVIGLDTPDATEETLDALYTVLLESSIRGRHASGLAWHDGQGLQRVVMPGPMEGLLASVDLRQLVRPDGSVCCIGHARYSTSDLAFNQPLVAGEYALAHNGVVSQADPREWPEPYGSQCEGRNDSELLLRALIGGEDPVRAFPGASVAAVWIARGSLHYGRNGLRPLWSAPLGVGRITASTADILRRAGLEPEPVVTATLPDLQETHR